MAKTWVEKRDCGKLSKVKLLEKSFAGMVKGCRMLISSPQEVDRFIREIPAGKTVAPSEMRKELAKKHHADATCPVSTGIFLRIVSEAALEEKRSGKKLNEITPFWRVAIEGTATAKKLSIDESELLLLRETNP